MLEPLKYDIHFKTVNDFRSLANMIFEFSVAGYVEEGDFHENIYALLEIMSHCPLEQLTLVITQYTKNDIPRINEFIRRSGLLNKIEVDAVV